MSSESHVEDQLSAYLDNALTSEERASVATHLQTCQFCNQILADYRFFDTVLKQQPRIEPDAALRTRIFSSLALLEPIEESTNHDIATLPSIRSLRETLPQQRVRPNSNPTRDFSAIPGTLSAPSQQLTSPNKYITQPQRRTARRLTIATIAASLLLVIGLGSLVGWSMLQTRNKAAQGIKGIVAPQDLRQGGPLPAGMRFIFLRGGSLWSAPEDSKTPPTPLTPSTVTVAANWAVRPAQAGHSAGNLVAYIDLQQGMIHVIRSDGQSDTLIKQPLLSTVTPAAWNTTSGNAIVHSLAWSPDGNTLAFIAAPQATPSLYLYTVNTGQMQSVALPTAGSIAHLVWAPDATRLAFEFTHNTTTAILDYNTQTHSMLVVAPDITMAQYPGDRVLTLDWAASTVPPAITWSVGTEGHVHSIWLRDVGVSATSIAASTHMLINGDFTQAIYSRIGANGLGGWILTHPSTSTTERLLTLTLNATFYELASGKHFAAIQWLADGKHIGYLDGDTMGTLHLLDASNGTNTSIANGVYGVPLPVWSPDGQQVAYNTATQSLIAPVHAETGRFLITGTATAYFWSVTTPHTLLVTLPQGKADTLSILTKRNATTTIISLHITNTSIAWTQIP